MSPTPALPKTNREVFDFVKAHLLTQNAKSVVERGSPDDDMPPACLYRGPNNLCCAVGALISDEAYDPEIEGIWTGDPKVMAAVTASLGFTPDIKLLRDLQQIHDDCDPEEWAADLELIHVPD